MLFKDMPIQKKLMRVIILIISVVLAVTCIAFFGYELYIFKKASREKLSTMGKIISANSTAALAFDNTDDAKEILSALKKEPNIVAAALYGKDGKIFAQYSSGANKDTFPAKAGPDGYRFGYSSLQGFEPVVQDNTRLGTLYLRSDLGAMYERFLIFGIVTAAVIFLSFLLAYLLSRILQRSISKPVLGLAGIATKISQLKDYSVRAVKAGDDEVGLLTEAFNNMLDEIEKQNDSLSEFTHNLEQKVQDRTAQVEAANKELEAFSYSISHDLRAPLRAVIGFTTMLEEKYSSQLDDEAKRIATVIKDNTLKMGTLIDDLLTFSRLGRQDMVKNIIPTAGLVEEVVKMLVAEPSRISWHIHPLPDMTGDINTMRQVWLNLISNAIKYSRNVVEPHIEIGSSNDGDGTVFFVKDNGVGFDEKYKAKLFKVFQRLHGAHEFEGTGVGLAIVERIVSKHGGTVWAEAKKGVGACFYFRLPLNGQLPDKDANNNFKYVQL